MIPFSMLIYDLMNIFRQALQNSYNIKFEG